MHKPYYLWPSTNPNRSAHRPGSQPCDCETTTPHVRSFWQSACATTNSRDDDVSRLTEQPQSRKRQRHCEERSRRKERGKEGERSDTCDKFVGVGFHCGQQASTSTRWEGGRQAAAQQNRRCRRSEILEDLGSLGDSEMLRVAGTIMPTRGIIPFTYRFRHILGRKVPRIPRLRASGRKRVFLGTFLPNIWRKR